MISSHLKALPWRVMPLFLKTDSKMVMSRPALSAMSKPVQSLKTAMADGVDEE